MSNAPPLLRLSGKKSFLPLYIYIGVLGQGGFLLSLRTESPYDLASPHDAHLLATFSQDSNVIRILDVRQPGQALLELRGHSSSINCIEWSPSRRGMLASGADDSLVLIWDLLNQNPHPAPSTTNSNPTNTTSTATAGGNTHTTTINGLQSTQHHPTTNPNTNTTTTTSGPDIARAPCASWRCDYEVNNLSWAPTLHHATTAQQAGAALGGGGVGGAGGDWIGVSGGRGIWGVKL